MVKGIQSVTDARRAVEELGAEALVVSNHGGRQLDRAPTPLELLPRVAEAVGDRTEVLIDSGVRTGADLAAVVAFGARAALVGRPYLYGLMAGGKQASPRRSRSTRPSCGAPCTCSGCRASKRWTARTPCSAELPAESPPDAEGQPTTATYTQTPVKRRKQNSSAALTGRLIRKCAGRLRSR